MKKNNILNVLIINILVVYFWGCSAAPQEIKETDSRKPIVIREDLGVFKFEKAISEIPKGKVIGG